MASLITSDPPSFLIFGASLRPSLPSNGDLLLQIVCCRGFAVEHPRLLWIVRDRDHHETAPFQKHRALHFLGRDLLRLARERDLRAGSIGERVDGEFERDLPLRLGPRVRVRDIRHDCGPLLLENFLDCAVAQISETDYLWPFVHRFLLRVREPFQARAGWGFSFEVELRTSRTCP